jgi:hypothetical protein
MNLESSRFPKGSVINLAQEGNFTLGSLTVIPSSGEVTAASFGWGLPEQFREIENQRLAEAQDLLRRAELLMRAGH